LLVASLFDLSAVPCQSASGVLALGSHFLLVMPGLDPGIHLLQESWIAGSSPAMTTKHQYRGNDHGDP
jgi:hypothetical protein